MLRSPFTPTSPHKRAIANLQETELQLQDMQNNLEYYTAMVSMLNARRVRLTGYVENFAVLAESERQKHPNAQP